MTDEPQGDLLGKKEPEKTPEPGTKEPLNNAPAVQSAPPDHNYDLEEMLSNPAVFDHTQRAAKLFSGATLVPDIYKGSIANCFIAMQFARQLDIPALSFMQKSYIVNGKPAIEGQLAIALLNRRGPWKHGIEYEYDGEGDDYGCTAYGVRKDTDKIQRSMKITIKVAKDAGWWAKNKLWQTITEQMMGYRAAMFLGRLYCPEVLLGLDVLEERMDIGGSIDTTATKIENVNSELLG